MSFQIIFCHGWGMDHHFWDRLVPFFKDSSCSCLDLGYLGPTLHTDLSSLALSPYPLIGIGHSLGLSKLLSLNLPFQALIGLQSFVNFLGYDPLLRAQRQRELKALSHHFNKDPLQTLLSFYQKCGFSSAERPSFESLSQAKMHQDLELIKHESSLLPSVPVFILGALDDEIVPPTLIKDNFQGQKNVTLKWYSTGKHQLGFSNPELVYNDSKDFLNTACKK